MRKYSAYPITTMAGYVMLAADTALTRQCLLRDTASCTEPPSRCGETVTSVSPVMVEEGLCTESVTVKGYVGRGYSLDPTVSAAQSC